MKNIFLFILFISVQKCFAQTYPVPQNLGRTPSTLVSTNSIRADQGIILGSFSDTTAANALPYLKNYTGAIIWSTGDSSLYVRLKTVTSQYWFRIGGAGGGATGSYWNLTGNYIPVTPAGLGIGLNDPFNPLNFKTNNLTRLTIPVAGILPFSASTDSILVRDASGNIGTIAKSAAGTPTWQQTITAGNTITTQAFINVASGLRYVDGNQAAGRVLVSDANGVASWAAAGGGIGSYEDSVANVMDFGATGNGSTEDSTAFQSAIATGRPVFVPKGVYKISATLTLSSKQMIFGTGGTSILYTTSTKALIKTADSCTVENLSFRGTGSTTSFPSINDQAQQMGIWINGFNNKVTGCTFFKILGRAVWIYSPTISNMEGNLITNNTVDSSTVAFSASFGSNYGIFANNSARYNYCGYYEDGAANMTNDANVYQGNTYALYFSQADLRGSVVNCQLNHSSVVFEEGSLYGYLITNCSFFNTNLTIGSVDTVKYLVFENCRFVGCTITGTRADSCYIRDGKFQGTVTTSGSGIIYQDIAGSTKPFSIPTDGISAGTNITITGSGSSASPYSISSSSVATAMPISGLTASGATNSITVGHSQVWNYNGITTGIGQRFTSNSITSGSIVDITGTSTALAANNEGLNIAISGANGTNGIIATGFNVAVSNTNATSGTNYGVYSTTSGATTENTSIIGESSGSGTSKGVYGVSSGSGSIPIGVHGAATNSGATGGRGVYGVSSASNGAGVYGAMTGTGYGGFFENNGSSGTGYALYATKDGAATTGIAGYFIATNATNNFAISIGGGAIGLSGSAGTSGQVLTSAGANSIPTWTTPSGGTPGGSDNEFQYNNGGAFGGTTGIEYYGAANMVLRSQAQAAADVALIGKAHASQSANIFEVQNSSGTAIANITAAGRLYYTDFTQAIGTDIQSGNVLGTGYNVLGASTSFGVKYRGNDASLPFEWFFGATGRAVVTAARVLEYQGTDVASAAGAIAATYGNSFEITGTNSITLISNVNWQNGSVIYLIFTSTAVLTDGTANSGTDIGMELPLGVNFTGSADDVVTLILSEMGGVQRWRCVSTSLN